MLTLPKPTVLVGRLLEQQLATAGLPTTVVLDGSVVELERLGEADRAAARAVFDAHPPTAQAALDKAASEHANESTIRDRADSALAANTTFLGIASPTNAQIAAQVKALTRQNNGLIRLVLRRFDSTD